MKSLATILFLVVALTGLLLTSGQDAGAFPCPPPKDSPAGQGASGAGSSVDPNQLIGPVGFGDKQYIPYGSIHAYRIDFENDSAAPLPAQQVDITNPLDQNLDRSTFQLTEVGFGDKFIPVPPGSKNFETTISTTYLGVTFDVKINAGIDESTGKVFAHFYSLDPETGVPPPAEIGFLPPEDGSGRGMGHVSYIINHVQSVAENTEIRNIALIIFDLGEEIYTNQVDPHDPGQGTDPTKEALVTIDIERPVSSMMPLPSKVATSTFTVSWTGSDSSSDIAGYNIFTRDAMESSWHLWQEKTTATSANFPGIPGHTHEFYSVAMDNVGNVEEKLPLPGTKTFVDPTPIIDSDNDGLADPDDNCPAIANADQKDSDGDGIGDICDPCPLDPANDIDSDGICGNIDNCPMVPNPD
ncbi:MAG: thrombospondin type 3 repeat-containing protein, partial [Thermodesulfobacteriota bacterium]